MTEAAVEHARLLERVAALADGELSADEARGVQEHLLGCARCRRELALHQGLSRSLAKEPLPEASAGLRRRIERVAAPNPASGGWPRNRRWAASAIAALVLIGIAFGAALRERDGQRTPIAGIPCSGMRSPTAAARRRGIFPARPISRPLALASASPSTLSTGQAWSCSAPGGRRSRALRRRALPIAGEGSSWSSTRFPRRSSAGSPTSERRCAERVSTSHPTRARGWLRSSQTEAAPS